MCAPCDHCPGAERTMKVVVAPVDDFAPGDRRIITVGGRSIGVFRVGDRFYAIRNRCPHQGGPLCQGRIAPWARSSGPGDFQLDAEATLLACPWHGWEYDLATGQSFLGPGEPGVKSYDVDVERGAQAARARARSVRRRDVPGLRRGGLRCRRCLATTAARPPPARLGERAVEARRRRHPPGAAAAATSPSVLDEPFRAPRALRRAGRQPAADVSARAQPGLPRRLVARGRLPRQRPRPPARAAARRVRRRLRDAHAAARPQLRRRGARVRRRARAAPSTTGSRGDGSTASARLHGSISIALEHARAGRAEIERHAGDERWVQVLLPDSAEYPLGNRKYWPIYEAAAAAGTAGRVHTGGIEHAPRPGLAVVLPRGARRNANAMAATVLRA